MVVKLLIEVAAAVFVGAISGSVWVSSCESCSKYSFSVRCFLLGEDWDGCRSVVWEEACSSCLRFFELRFSDVSLCLRWVLSFCACI